MGLGTLFGGWRIVKTPWAMADHQVETRRRLLRFDERRDDAVFSPLGSGIPVSTTHTITGSIIGVGSARKLSAVRGARRQHRFGRGFSPSRLGFSSPP